MPTGFLCYAQVELETIKQTLYAASYIYALKFICFKIPSDIGWDMSTSQNTPIYKYIDVYSSIYTQISMKISAYMSFKYVYTIVYMYIWMYIAIYTYIYSMYAT